MNVNPSHFARGSAILVHGSSMQPFLLDGDIVFLEPVDPTSLYAGDVVFVQWENGGSQLCHRVVRIDEKQCCFTMRGDAMIRTEHVCWGGKTLPRIQRVIACSRRGGPAKALRRLDNLTALWRARFLLPFRFCVRRLRDAG